MCNFEKDLAKLWTCINDQNKKAMDKIHEIEERAESTDYNLGLFSSKVEQLESRSKQLADDLTYVQSQSMRNNLVFGNIEEARQGESEDTELVLRGFLVEKMKIASDLVAQLKFERVHRMGERQRGRDRKIVAKFNLFKERELVRKSWKSLDNSKYFVHEQFPKEVIDKRRALIPKMKEARTKGQRAWLSYDTLYIDGKAQRDDRR